jgi:hypothetical protein
MSIARSPQAYARCGGLLYLLIILFGGFAEGFVSGKLVVSGDATATARNILAAPALWQLGAAANLVVPLLAVALLWIEYQLLRPVDASLVLLGVLFNVVSLAVESVSKVFMILVLPMLQDPDYAKVFAPQQLQALAKLAFQTHDIAFNISLIFFAGALLVNGHLIFRSGYLPRFIGVLAQLAGLGYLVACFATLFAPAFADAIEPGILVVPLVGESSYCLWLLLKGVDVKKWNARVNPGALTPGAG